MVSPYLESAWQWLLKSQCFSDPLGSRHLLIPFCGCANRLGRGQVCHTGAHYRPFQAPGFELGCVQSPEQLTLSFLLMPLHPSLESLAVPRQGRWLAPQCRDSDMTVSSCAEGTDSPRCHRQALGTSLVWSAVSKGGWKLSGLDCAAEGSVTFSLTTCGKSHYLLTFGSCFLLVEISEGWKYTQVCLCGSSSEEEEAHLLSLSLHYSLIGLTNQTLRNQALKPCFLQRLF